MTSTKVRRRSPLAGFLVLLTVAVAAALLLIGFWPGPVRAETGPKRPGDALHDADLQDRRLMACPRLAEQARPRASTDEETRRD